MRVDVVVIQNQTPHRAETRSMSTPQRFKLATTAALSGARDGGLQAPAAGLRAPVLTKRQASVQLELPFAPEAQRQRAGLRTG